jgi:hypothetical protein
MRTRSQRQWYPPLRKERARVGHPLSLVMPARSRAWATRLRRFTRLTNAHSRKLENLKHSVTLYMCWYNFCRVHQTLRVTPSMEAGLTTRVWTLEELLSN